ncbi:MAG: hypothetical protein JWR44_2745 [Hymenobacter sp.]|jgi:hypothetical protein|nr:hypothetical protein [Hymenobacter sp.]
MKPELARRVARHGLFWLALWGFFLFIQLPEHFASGRIIYWREYLFIQLPLSLLTIYPLLYLMLPQLLHRRQLGLFLVLLAGWLVVGAGLAGLLQAFYRHVVLPGLFGENLWPPFQWQEVTGGLTFGFFALVATGGLVCVVTGVNYWYEQRQLSVHLQQQRLQTELQLLKAQLQPPFLFRTLQTLQELTLHKSATAPAAVLHLSALLRYMLYESPLDEVPLTDEVEMMEHYVALEKLRLGDRVDVSLNFSGALAAHTIAPLLLLPFLENAFRHGTDGEQECPWVSIDLVAKRNSLTLKVINSCRHAVPGVSGGPDLGDIRQRLSHLYPGRNELKVVAEPDTHLVALHLRFAPAHPAPGTPAPLLLSTMST